MLDEPAALLPPGLGFFPEERYFFPSNGKKWVFTGKKTFLLGRNWEETPKVTESVTIIN